MLPELTALFPITVICAICLFLLKEGLEYRRRNLGDARKRSGIVQLLERECVENIRAAEQIEHVCKDIRESEELKDSDEIDYDCEHRIRFTKAGSVLYECYFPGGQYHSGKMIPAISRDALNKHMLDAASLGGPLFNSMQDLQTLLVDVEDMRSSLITYLDDDQGFLPMFCGYAKSHLPEIRVKLAALHKDITGREPIVQAVFPLRQAKP